MQQIIKTVHYFIYLCRMNTTVSCLSCSEYDVDIIVPLLEEAYTKTEGPEVAGKTILLKPNILFDETPNKAVTTHPVFVEAVIRFLKSRQAGKIYVGDAPAVHTASFMPRKSGIYEVCERMGVEWVFFGKKSLSRSLPSGKVPVTSVVNEVDYFFSLPKLKTHELMGYSGAIKNSFGLIPHIHKAKQHAIHRSSRSMASFLLDLNEAITPDYIFMDAIVSMEGPGPGNGFPYPLHLLLGSVNPLALDIVASKIIGYPPLEIETNFEGLQRKRWLSSIDQIVVHGVELDRHIRTDYKLTRKVSLTKMSLGILIRRIPFVRNMERRPHFFKKRCIGCQRCIEICPVQALGVHHRDPKSIKIVTQKCIHCFCCHEICPNNAIEIR